MCGSKCRNIIVRFTPLPHILTHSTQLHAGTERCKLGEGDQMINRMKDLYIAFPRNLVLRITAQTQGMFNENKSQIHSR